MSTNISIHLKFHSPRDRCRGRFPEIGNGYGHGNGHGKGRKGLVLIIALSLLTTVIIAAPAHTQEKNPKHFYPKNFANGNDILEGDSHTKKPNTRVDASHQSGAPSTAEANDLSSDSTKEQPHDSNQALPKLTELSGLKIDAASLILTTSDQANAERSYQEFLTLRDKFGIKLSEVYLIGDPRGLMRSEVIYSQGADGGMFRYLNEMPKAFESIKTSPTIILETNDGNILLEGFRSISSVFNAKGEFIEPK